MFDHIRLPWHQIYDYLLETESAVNPDDFCRKAMLGLEKVLPYDSATFFLTDPNGSQVEKWDQVGLQHKDLSDYQDHYVHVDCFKPKLWQSGKTGHIEWSRFQNTEFVTDFINRQPIRFTSGLLLFDPENSRIAALTFHRSVPKGYKDHEIAVFDALQPHLTNLFSLISKINRPDNKRFYHAEMVRDCKLLSKREAEVASFLCQRLTFSEIATKLFISPRTVEFHVNNIYQKLKVRNRRELIVKLSGNQNTSKQ